jgi:hypothetical protein
MQLPTPTPYPLVESPDLILEIDGNGGLTAWGVADDVIQTWNSTAANTNLITVIEVFFLVAIIVLFSYLIVKRLQHMSEERE